MRVRMHNERLKDRPPLPRSLSELAQVLEQMPRYANIYIASVFSGNSAAILFGNAEMIAALGEFEDLAADATFAVCCWPYWSDIYERKIIEDY